MKMKLQHRSSRQHKSSSSLDRKLASYLAASATVGAVMVSEAKAIVISNPTVQNVGINGFANIDFNSDGQTDFQIDHDRIDLTSHGGPVVDFLQIDKNDINGARPGENPLAFDPLTNLQAATFPPNGTTPNDADNAAYVVAVPPTQQDQSGNTFHVVQYPSALLAGA